MSHLPTWSDLLNATSSPESAAGATQLVSLDGLILSLYGPEVVPANRSRSPEQAQVKRTRGISGRSSSASSPDAGPLSSWESRLRQRLERIGSTECLLTWKASTTPAGRPLSRLVPSIRPIVEIDYGLWPTPTAMDHSRGLSVRPHDKGIPLPQRVMQSLWPSPTASLADKAIRSPQGARQEIGRNKSPDLAAHVMALWPTPSASPWRSESASPEFHAVWAANPKGKTLPMTIALWNTPTSLAPARDGNNEAGNSTGLVSIRGHAMAGLPGQTENPGALNPEFVSWLMGFPADWLFVAPSDKANPRSKKSIGTTGSEHYAALATPSSRKWRPKSSAPTLTSYERFLESIFN